MRTDDQLMMAHRAGELGAFDALVTRHRRALFGFLRRMLRDDALAEEALMDTFFRVHRGAASYEPRGQFKTFLFRVAHRQALNSLRAGRRWTHETARLEDRPGGVATVEDLGTLPRPDEALSSRELAETLDRALTTLPEVQRAVFLLFYREGLPTAEIAEVVAIPAGSVRAYLTMARKVLREALETSAHPIRGPQSGA